MKLCVVWLPLGIIDPDAIPDDVSGDTPVPAVELVVTPVCPVGDIVVLDSGKGGDD